MPDVEPSKENDAPAVPAAEAGENKVSDAPIQSDEETDTAPVEGNVKHHCPYPDCGFETQRIQALHGHVRFVHQYKGDILPGTEKKESPKPAASAPIASAPQPAAAPPAPAPAAAAPASPAPAPQAKAPPPYPPYRGGTNTNIPKSKPETAAETDIGRKAEVRGLVKQVLKTIAISAPEKQELLSPQREICIEYIKVLNKAEVSDEQIGEIETMMESRIKPEVRQVLDGPAPEKTTQPKTTLPGGIGYMTRITDLRGKVRRALGDFFKLSTGKKEELSSEKETLTMLHQKLSTTDIPLKDLEDMEGHFNGIVLPVITEALRMEAKKVPAAQPKSGDDVIENEIAMREQELKLERMDRMLEEERMRRKQNMLALNQQTQSGALVPTYSPKLNDKGEVIKDENGNLIMETKYAPVDQAKGSNDMLLAMLLSGKLGGGDDTMKTLLPILMNNNTQIITALISQQGKKEGPSFEELMLKMQNEQMKFMMSLEEKRHAAGEDPNLKAMREELKATREENARTRDAMFQQQMGYMNREMEDLKQYAYRDPLEELKKKRAQLEELGIINPKEKDAEAEALKESSKLMDKGIQKLDKVSDDAKELLGPLVKAQARALENQGGPQPLRKAATEQEKVAAYRGMLAKLESAEEEEEQEE